MIGNRLLDDAYMAWVVAESECERALQAWFHESSSSCPESYWVYTAALDQEEAAAHDLPRRRRCRGGVVVCTREVDRRLETAGGPKEMYQD